METITWVWSFHGDEAQFTSAVFSSKEAAEEWIQRHAVSGVLTRMPLDMGSYAMIKESNSILR